MLDQPGEWLSGTGTTGVLAYWPPAGAEER